MTIRFVIQTALLAAVFSCADTQAQPGARSLPARVIPVPTQDVSPQIQAVIGQPYSSSFNADPKTPAEWKELVTRRAADAIAGLPAMKEKLGVTVQATEIGGVKAFLVTPKSVPPRNRNRLLVHVHGGGYVFSPGEAGLPEAILLAGFGGYKVISVDYRMPARPPVPGRHG